MKWVYDTLSVAWKEIQLMISDRGALALFFLLPLLIGFVMGGANLAAKSGEEAAILLKVGLVNHDSGHFGQEVEKAIESIAELKVERYDAVAAAEERVAKGEAAAAIVIPADFSEKIKSYTPTSVEVIVDPGQPESASIVAGMMNDVVAEVTIWGEVQYGIRTIHDESGVLVGVSPQERQAAEAQTLGVIMTTLNEIRRTPAIAVVTQDLEGVILEGGWEAYLALMFSGIAAMFIFLNVTWSASSLLRERESGTLRRLIAAPIARGAIIGGKIVSFMMLSCTQVILLFGVAAAFFKIPLGSSPPALVALTLAVALTSATMGLMVAALAKSANQAGNIGLILGFVLAGIGGSIAVANTPFIRQGGFLGTLASLTPQGHAIEGFYSVMAEKAGFAQVLPELGVLLAMGIVFFLISTWRFRFES